MSWDALDKIDKGSDEDKKWLHDTFHVCHRMKNTVARDLSNWLQSIWFNMAMGKAMQHQHLSINSHVILV